MLIKKRQKLNLPNEVAKMNTEDIIKDVKKLIKTIVPPTIEITNIELEGPDIAVYTKNIEEFADNNDIVRVEWRYARTPVY
jgi:predicted metal-dependent RNase